ncbi:cytochrome c oxidase assembly protein [Ferrimonas balearica]|uniref:cytochrome c oxidase assembly protein n=1 Tax=Ferrimonas balearica TaxID=44012 RepID=UPI001C5B24A1|nr:cytochrome c oxidase assembly protein [Ferrimonas balearica]MBW3166034.1 cytochrome c oxidase assembly protein [Ferrimonas balearica]MBY6096221.1 cytochrome c oxidase assembly protein [Ferrimonas balearica]
MANAQENRRLITTLIGVVVGMFGFGFALVPLYDVFCEITGINGKTSGEVAAQSRTVDEQRVVTVEFIARVQGDMPWEFKPVVNRLKVHPGESRQVAFYARNLSGEATVGQAIPSVSPGLGALYFSKVECFCFNQQPLAAGEEAELGLLFYLDPELPPEIQTVTLSYTLYNITDKVSERG